MRVEAGPGTGKTFGLRRRVLRLLHRNGLAVDANSVLVCSFNRVIAQDLREEIEDELGEFGLGIPRVTTVHSLCASILGASPRFLLPHETEVMIYDVRVAHPALNEEYEREQRNAMRALREHEAGVGDHPGLAAAVNEWLADHQASIVGDVTRRALAGLEAGDYESGVFEHVVVDEFQDLTETEAQILVRLCAEDGHLVAVGDRKQSIYAFRGNDERGLEALPDLVDDDVEDHPMNECQRCHREVVLLANAVMALEGDPLVDVRGPGSQIHQVRFDTPDDEASGMADAIATTFQARPDDRHLVLVTRRRWGYDLRNAIRAAYPDVPVETAFSEDILETWPAREAFMFLEVLGAPDPVCLRDWVAYKPPTDGKDFKAPSRNAKAYPLKADHGILTLDLIGELEGQPASAFRGSGKGNLLGRLDRLRDLLNTVPDTDEPAELVDEVFDPDRWIDFAGSHADLAREDIERLNREAHKLLGGMNEPSLKSLVEQLRYRIATREPLGRADGVGVRIVTLWGAKGLTADFVYILGLVDEALPGPHRPESTGLRAGEHLAEQRRLLYVSLTRAKKALTLSRPREIRRGEVPALGLERTASGTRWRQRLHRTRFLDDLPRGVLPAVVDGDEWAGIELE